MKQVDHLYVHVPFCSGKCVYCAFYSVPYDAALADKYLDALAAEFDSLLDTLPSPRTV